MGAINTSKASSMHFGALVAPLLAICIFIAPAAAHAAESKPFGIVPGGFEAGTCNPVNKNSETTEQEINGQCTYKVLEEEIAKSEPTRAYTQADGHPKYGLTAFEFDNVEFEKEKYEIFGTVKSLRVDLPAGLSVNPMAVPRCPLATFEESLSGKDACPADTKVGENLVQAVFSNSKLLPKGTLVHIPLPIYNLVPPAGMPLEVGIYNELGPERQYLEGHVSWHTESEPNSPKGIATGDFHEYFTISGLPYKALGTLPIAIKKIQQVFYGNAAGAGFLRLPSLCGRESTRTHVVATSYSHAEDTELPAEMGNETVEASTVPPEPLAVIECSKPPFNPALSVTSKTTTSDAPSGVQVNVSAKQNENSSELDSSDIKNAVVTLPEGMTINPAAAAGIEGCTPLQIAGEEANEHKQYEVECPEGSQIGTAELETPLLPQGSLSGNIYLGKPDSGAITGSPYIIYVTAENIAEYGVAIRLKGIVRPNPLTGRLETTFENNPQLPFTNLRLHFRGGPLAPLANPLQCAAGTSTASFTPFTGTPASIAPEVAPFIVTGCSSAAPPFAAPGLAQAAGALPAEAARNSTFTTSISRQQGQQYISQVQTTLPAGVVAQIPNASPCAEAPANEGSCAAASKIGEVAVEVGSGGAPFTFNGTVFLTEHYGGAPFGLSIVVPAVVGPFNLGNVVTRASVSIDPHSARVTVTASLPSIVKGIPIRLRGFKLAINRPSFELNPTDCSVLHTETTLSGTTVLPPSADATVGLSTPFQAEGCAGLPFTPILSASTSASVSRLHGAGLQVAIKQATGQANIASVTTTLPGQLPSRQSTLNQACPEATANANVLNCPAAAKVGSAEVSTPTLPGVLSGPAYIVSQGGHAFPNLELVLEGDGVRIDLIGNTEIKNGITTSTFAANPDVPISSFQLKLPMAANSLFSFNGSLCKRPLLMPTTIAGQNGKTIEQSTHISVADCLPVLKHRALRRRFALITVKAPAAGRIAMRGFGLKLAVRRAKRAGAVTLRIPLALAGKNALHARHHFRTRVRIGFLPRMKGGAAFVSYTNVNFR